MSDEELTPAQRMQRNAQERVELRRIIRKHFGAIGASRLAGIDSAKGLKDLIAKLEVELVELAKERERQMKNPLWGQF